MFWLWAIVLFLRILWRAIVLFPRIRPVRESAKRERSKHGHFGSTGPAKERRQSIASNSENTYEGKTFRRTSKTPEVNSETCTKASEPNSSNATTSPSNESVGSIPKISVLMQGNCHGSTQAGNLSLRSQTKVTGVQTLARE